MKTVLVRGPTLSQSGYGTHSRQIARWLLSKPNLDVHFQVLPWGTTPWLIDPESDDGLIGQIMSRTNPLNRKADVTFQIQLPNEFDVSLGNYNVGITAGVETDRCNQDWVSSCNTLNHLIVPSQHVLNTFTNSGQLFTRTSVVPESYPRYFDKHETIDISDKFSPSTSFNFLLFGQITGNNPDNDRKNTFYALRWLCETFKDDKDVGIVIKTNMGRNTKIDLHTTKNLINQILREVRKDGSFPKIHLVHGTLNDAEIYSLYRHPSVKALLAPTRGEGFGLPILEAAVAELPIVATNWSGHLDFLNMGKFIKLDYQLKPIHSSRVDNKIFIEGTKWAEPSEQDFKRKVQKLKSSYSLPKEWAVDLAKKLKDTHSFNSISKRYDELFTSVL